MKNDQRDLDHIASWTTKLSLYGKPETVPENVVDYIDGVYILIPKDHFPDVTFGSLDDAFAGENHARTKDLSEHAYGGDTKMMREVGLQYLALAAYLEERATNDQIKQAAARRFKVFRDLFPESNVSSEQFRWENLTEFEQRVIDKMVLLKMEVDKDF